MAKQDFTRLDCLKTLSWVLLILTLALLLVACGDASPAASGTNATPSGLVNTPVLQLEACQKQATLNAPATTPQSVNSNKVDVPIGFKIFLSEIFPYALAYPSGWDLQKSQTRNDVKGDFFVASNQDNKRIFVTITGRKLPDGVTDLPSFFKTLEKDFAQQSVNYTREADHQIGGVNAYVVSFNTDQPGFQVQTIQLVFVAQNQAWNISYNVSYNQPLSYCADFARMLDSFTFTSH